MPRMQSTYTEQDIDDVARQMWDRGPRPELVSELKWEQVGGLMRFIYMGKAAEWLVNINREPSPYPLLMSWSEDEIRDLARDEIRKARS